MRMREMLFAAVAAAALIAGGLLANRAEAMPAPPSALRAAAADTGLVHRVVNVCGGNGCVKVQTQRVVKRHLPPPPPHH
jgi:hypothetical protein